MTDTVRSDPIRPMTARYVLWLFDRRPDLAVEPAGFVRALYEAIGRADPLNEQRLSLGFPEDVAAYRLAAYTPNGVNRLAYFATIDRGCYHPRSCAGCDRAGHACGSHDCCCGWGPG